ncbi:GTP-binding protein [Leuconostoc mesenteroides]
MSFFTIFKKKKATEKNIKVESEPVTWKNTTNATEFFEGYNVAITDLESNGEVAAAETLRADKTQIQIDFIERFEKEMQSKTTGIQDIDARTKIVIDAISSIRKYNSEMPIAVRTRLAQAKKNLIGE